MFTATAAPVQAAVPSHTGQLAATFCLPAWPVVLDRLTGLDTDLVDQLALAAAWLEH